MGLRGGARRLKGYRQSERTVKHEQPQAVGGGGDWRVFAVFGVAGFLLAMHGYVAEKGGWKNEGIRA